MDKPSSLSPTQNKDSKFDFKSFRTFFKGKPSAPEVPLNEQLEALKQQQKSDLIKHMTKQGLIQTGLDYHSQLLELLQEAFKKNEG